MVLSHTKLPSPLEVNSLYQIDNQDNRYEEEQGLRSLSRYIGLYLKLDVNEIGEAIYVFVSLRGYLELYRSCILTIKHA